MKFIRQSRLRSKFTGKKVRLDYKRTLPVAALILIIVLVTAVLSLKTTTPSGDSTAQAEAYQEQLQSQVDTETGEPRSGRDPGTQLQTSLASAASSPTGAAYNKPATTVTGNNGQNGNPSPTAIGANGCFIDYGIPGEHCVPAHVATNGTLTCNGVHNAGFHNGVKVSGTDRFNLDTNHDGTACGAGE